MRSHYDVIPAPAEGWDSDPFTLTGRNGYLYGRGVTDDKGPILATACAAAELLARRALDLELIFLIEGEEECGSSGFGDAVQRHKVRKPSPFRWGIVLMAPQDLIGHVDAILVR